uniref:Uncharacterized protein n=1 Tax=Rhizophora mucronata TaxID=61149 RepID=A0A2P2QZ59_RHIMU
MTSPKSLDL